MLLSSTKNRKTEISVSACQGNRADLKNGSAFICFMVSVHDSGRLKMTVSESFENSQSRSMIIFDSLQTSVFVPESESAAMAETVSHKTG